jgi:hypothetical protein
VLNDPAFANPFALSDAAPPTKAAPAWHDRTWEKRAPSGSSWFFKTNFLRLPRNAEHLFGGKKF